jgi:glycosyltransferase involved in cell wall biosynthesis
MSDAAVRVLQLLDPSAGFSANRAAEILHGSLGAGFEVAVEPIDGAGVSAIRRVRTRSPRSRDFIHAFGTRALTVAAIGGGGGPTVFTPNDAPTRKQLGWLRAVMTYRNVHVVCPSGALHRRFVEGGIPFRRCHVVWPGVDFARIRKRRDAELRKALGFSEEDRVLLLVGESTRASGHAEALWAAAILHVLDPRWKVLAWGRGPRTNALVHFALSQKHTSLVSIAERRLGRRVEFEELFPAADVLMVTPAKPVATLPIALAMASGLPIVGTASGVVGEMLEDRHTALLAPPGSPRALARRVLDLTEHPKLQWAISDQARAEAYQYFPLTKFIEQHRTLHRQVAAGEDVELTDATAGQVGAT